MQSEINIAIGARAPSTYFSEMVDQCRNGALRFGGITDLARLQENLAAHCIPQEMETKTAEGYDDFLMERRSLMATKLRDYYEGL